ncbi:UPF0158 family protein, partial [Chlamydiia bacterium]|nr:UPF0158 family protein [Chlamydiia bacterium]
YNPSILRLLRLISVFSKSDDERDYYFNRIEGFILYMDLDTQEDQINALSNEVQQNAEVYISIPKITFYEQKKLLESFVQEKVYDIDIKEKLSEMIQGNNPRANFLEFINDHVAEFEKWQTFFVEKFRIKVIEWLRTNKCNFVFEEDMEFDNLLMDKVKRVQTQESVSRDITVARKQLEKKAKTYYSHEALNPKPKRGRPPKQAQKIESVTSMTNDYYTMIPRDLYAFLFVPRLNSTRELTFSSEHETQEEYDTSLVDADSENDTLSSLENLTKKIKSMQSLQDKLSSN